jgi:hypothetical protein
MTSSSSVPAARDFVPRWGWRRPARDLRGRMVFEGACVSCHGWTGESSMSPMATLTVPFEADSITPFDEALGPRPCRGRRELASLVDFRWHDLRHTFASRMLRASRSRERVQEAMGHARRR